MEGNIVEMSSVVSDIGIGSQYVMLASGNPVYVVLSLVLVLCDGTGIGICGTGGVKTILFPLSYGPYVLVASASAGGTCRALLPCQYQCHI